MVLVSAIDGHQHNLGSVQISNDGRTDASERLHSYDVQILNKNGRIFRDGRVENWDREGKSPMQLLAAALKAAGY